MDTAVDKVLVILERYAPRSALTAHPPDELRLESLGLNSVETIRLLAEIEDTFDLEVDVEYIQKLHTLGDLVRAVETLGRQG
jgi:acyl carrier protein